MKATNLIDDNRAYFADMLADLMARKDQIFDERIEGDTETQAYNPDELAEMWGMNPNYVRSVFRCCKVSRCRVLHRRHGAPTPFYCPEQAVREIREQRKNRPLMVRRFLDKLKKAPRHENQKGKGGAKTQR